MGFFLSELRTPVNAKNCPFCGSNEIVVSARNHYDNLVAEHGSSCVIAECTDCDTKVYYYGIHDDDQSYDHMIEMVLAKWNTRRETA